MSYRVGAHEIVGAQEIIGDELDALVSGDEIIGATTHKPRSGLHAQVVNRAPDRLRRMTIGFGTTAVTTGQSVTISITPQETFRPERMIIPSSIAADYSITDIKVGQRSQLVASGAIPAMVYSEVSVDSYVHWDTANVGNTISLTITNNGAGTTNFVGALHGTVAM
jgi:hypothetical protein